MIAAIRLLKLLFAALIPVVLLLVFAGVGSYVYLRPALPTAQAMKTGTLPVPLRIFTRSGQLIAQIGEERRTPVQYEDIPPLVREAFISAEDQRFFQHHGFDYSGAVRALLADIGSHRIVQGASTITMQAARNMYLNQDRSLRRKLLEIFVTYRMEHDFTKEQILTTYLNVIFLGRRSYGVAAAAETYFGKSLDQLTVAEAATLAGITSSPVKGEPIAHPAAALNRRHYVLQQMLRFGYIDASTEAAAEAETLSAHDHGVRTQVDAPYVAEMVRADIINRFGPDAIKAGYTVYTTLDGRLQTAANRALRLGLIAYDRRHGYRGVIRNLELDAHSDVASIESKIRDVPEYGVLRPAVVESVAPNAARVLVRGQGYAQIDWSGMSWARPVQGDGAGPAPKHAADVLRRGDVIYVVADGQGHAQLAQVPEAQGALVALDPDDGAVASLVGGFDYYGNKFNRATQARRQPGSGFKPFLYSAALEDGFTPASIVMDLPIVYGGDVDQEQVWRPKDNEKGFEGPITVRNALVHSRNLATIRMVDQMGIDEVMTYATRFGFNRQDMPRNMTLALGTLPATPMQMASAYSVFANGGYRVDPYFIDRIIDAGGNIVYQAHPATVCEACDPTLVAKPGDTTPDAEPDPATPATPQVVATVAPGADANAPTDPNAIPGGVPPAPPPKPVLQPLVNNRPTTPVDADHRPADMAVALPPAQVAPRVVTAANAWLMDDMMADVIKRGTGIRAGMALHRGDIAGKTGTTNEARDAWFNGFNRHMVATVWVGYDQEKSLGEGEEGSRTAVPIWTTFMREALRGQPDVPRSIPPGLVRARISPSTGLLLSTNDPFGATEIFIAGHLPRVGEAGATPSDTNIQNKTGGSEPLF